MCLSLQLNLFAWGSPLQGTRVSTPLVLSTTPSKLAPLGVWADQQFCRLLQLHWPLVEGKLMSPSPLDECLQSIEPKIEHDAGTKGLQFL